MGNDLNDHEALLSCPFSICISSKKKKIKISNGINIKESNVEFLLYYLLAYLKAGFSVNDYKCDIVKENLNVPLIVRLSDSKTDILNIRFAARGVVYTSSGDVVLFYKERIGEIKLPGGGLENNEKPLEGFIREVSEEIGYDVCDVKLVGYSIERKERNNFKQFSFVFTAKTKNPNNPHPTLEEQLDYSKGINCTIEEALSKFDNALKQLKNLDDIDLYHEKFIVKRDKKIFNYVIKGN